MRNVLWLAVVSLGVCTGSVQAQGLPGAAGANPAVSPYLNLLRRDSPEYLNYFGLVRPQLDFSGAIQQLQSGQAATNAQQAMFQNLLTLPATGHASSFNSHLRYFNTNSGGGLGGMGFGGGGLPGMGGAGLPGGGGLPGMGGGGVPGMGGGGMPGMGAAGMPTAPR